MDASGRTWSGGVALAALLCWAGSAAAVTLRASSATVAAPGDLAEVCISLDTGGAEVAGTQNDLVWDGHCATLRSGADCFVAGMHGKQLRGDLLPQLDFTYRALILSLTDVDPIPDGQLYCCAFQVNLDTPGTCCPVAVRRQGFSDSRGNELIGTTPQDGQVCLAAAGSAPGPGGDGTAPQVETGGTGGGGCQTTDPRRGAGTAAALLLPALAWLALRRRPRPAAARC
jgi:hypothetical protein